MLHFICDFGKIGDIINGTIWRYRLGLVKVQLISTLREDIVLLFGNVFLCTACSMWLLFSLEWGVPNLQEVGINKIVTLLFRRQ